MKDRIYFSYERMEPMKYPEQRDTRMKLTKYICDMYKNKPISDIPLSTEIILKTLKPKDPSKADIILLKYKVINEDWDNTRYDKDTIFINSLFKWVKEEEIDYSSW
jgi:hypothetical protein